MTTAFPAEVLGELLSDNSDVPGLRGVALGAKETGGVANFDQLAVTFFVDRKIPLASSGTLLANGERALAKSVTLGEQTLPTDIVPLEQRPATPAGQRTNKPLMVPGGRIRSVMEGTHACLVRTAAGATFSLTDQHVTGNTGNKVAFHVGLLPMLLRPVARATLHAPVLSFLGHSPSGPRVRVDASLIDIMTDQVQKFSGTSPHLGAIRGVLPTPQGDILGYARALVGLPVQSYSWASKFRSGRISHSNFVFEDEDGGQSQFCFLVTSETNQILGLPGDSGKLWLTRQGSELLGVGLHLGEMTIHKTGTRHAAATDLHALCRHFDVTLFNPTV